MQQYTISDTGKEHLPAAIPLDSRRHEIENGATLTTSEVLAVIVTAGNINPNLFTIQEEA